MLSRADCSRLNRKLKVCMFGNADCDRSGAIWLDEFKAAHVRKLKKKYEVSGWPEVASTGR